MPANYKSMPHFNRLNLFLIRIWNESPTAQGEADGENDNVVQWHGRVQRISSGETLYFEGWEGLAALLERFLASPASNNYSISSDDEGNPGHSVSPYEPG
jgi:hypothetical protein